MGQANWKMWGDIVAANAASFGDKPAFVSGDQSWSFADVHCRINRLNNVFFELGLRTGDRVAILSRNRPEYFEVYGVAQSGLIAVPLNWRLAKNELLQILNDSSPAAIVVEPQFQQVIDSIAAELPGLHHFIVLGEASDQWRSYESLLSAASADTRAVDVNSGQAACLVYSSGTSGAPKGVEWTNTRVLNTCRAVAEDMLKLTQQDVALSVMPWFHAGGMWYHVFPSFAAGNTTVVLPEFESRIVLEEIRTRGVTQLHVVPTMINALLNEPGIESMDLRQLRLIKYAASSIPVSLLKRALKIFRHCGFVQSYGMTEMGAATILSSEDHASAAAHSSKEELLLSCGRAMPGVKIEIRGASGAALEPREIGDIVMHSNRVMSGYWKNSDLTAKTVIDGWLHTGDMGYLDEGGYLYIVDRKHDMIVTGGENVYPREVEEVLYQDPSVAEAAVFAIPDPKWVERVAAAIVLKPGHSSTSEDIRRHAARHLASYKCPKTVLFVESLPKNASGKVLKKDLRKQYSDHAV